MASAGFAIAARRHRHLRRLGKVTAGAYASSSHRNQQQQQQQQQQQCDAQDLLPLRERACAYICSASELVGIVDACAESTAAAASMRDLSVEDTRLIDRDLAWLIEDAICPPGGPPPGRFSQWLDELRRVSSSTSSSSSSTSTSTSAYRLRVRPSRIRDLWQDRLGSETCLPIPLQYITKTAHWLGIDIVVERGACLIPRPETETLAELAMRALSRHGGGGTWADIGTGSGCLAVALAAHAADENVANTRIIASDISSEALRIAAVNAAWERARQLQSYGHARVPILLREGSLFGPLMRRNGVDAERDEGMRARDEDEAGSRFLAGIVSNPPYIAPSALPTLQEEVRGHEPWLALDGGGAHGDALLLDLLGQAPRLLKPGAFIGIETGGGAQIERVALAMQTDGRYHTIDVHKDIYGLDRFITAHASP